ncbi:MAG: OadG family transporter subunit [Gammaproteobacteria bacterium]|nr:OadG family transporter subunit [Gammaproteobacteria bacterium]
MPIESLLTEATGLLILGMGSVFIILGLLVYCMSIMARWLPAFDKDHPAINEQDAPMPQALLYVANLYRKFHQQAPTP